MRNRKPPLAEFAQQIGEKPPVQGDPRVTGLVKRPVNAPPGIAPPSPLQVVSTFDTRPISAYDFSLIQTGIGEFAPEAPSAIINPQTLPQGYTLVLRRVLLECFPGFVGQSGYTADAGSSLSFFMLRDGAVIPNNELRLGTLTTFAWETHQVFGYWQTIGLRATLNIGTPDPLSGFNYDFRVTYQGTLIPSKGLPANEEVGSDPVLIRLFQNPVAR